MKTNDLKKGDRVVLAGTGWNATIEDNKKGNIRMATVEGFFTEMGSVYSHDIQYYVSPEGEYVPIEHTDAQRKLKRKVATF